MDTAFNQHSMAAKRKQRSSTNLNHLSMAPLTTRLPLHDAETDYAQANLPTYPRSASYLQGRSAPSTPSIFTRGVAPTSGSQSRQRSRSRKGLPASTALPLTDITNASLSKSKSAIQLHRRKPSGKSSSAYASGTTSPVHRRHGPKTIDKSDSDWLLRAGALISSETRESKGQAWLTSRESSTSLAGLREAAYEASYEQPLAKSRGASRHHSRTNSRRGSSSVTFFPEEDDFVSAYATPTNGRSRRGSRQASRIASQLNLLVTPSERQPPGGGIDGYFENETETEGHAQIGEQRYPGPDFVNLDDRIEGRYTTPNAEEGSYEDEEAHVRRLFKRGGTGKGTWFGSMLGWGSLFSVSENEEVADTEDEREDEGDDGGDALERYREQRRRSMVKHLESLNQAAPGAETPTPPPKKDEGGWKDAAWLLSVASKVLL